MNDPEFLAKKFLSYIECNERLLTFDYASQQKYFICIQ